MAGDELLNVVDLDALQFGRAHEIANGVLRRLDTQRGAVERRMREQTIDRAFEIAAIGGDRPRDIGDDFARHFEAGVLLLCGGDARFEDLHAQRFVERTDVDREPALETRQHALVELIEFGRRAIGGDDDLLAESMSAFSVWQNSCWMVLPCRNCTSSMMRMSMPRSFSLKAKAVCAFSADTKPLMNFSAVR